MGALVDGRLHHALQLLETRVAELERQVAELKKERRVLDVGDCERCTVLHERAKCVNCERHLCRACLGTESCDRSFSGEHHS